MELDKQGFELFYIDLEEATLTLKKYEAGLRSLYTTKEHLRIDLKKLVDWIEDY